MLVELIQSSQHVYCFRRLLIGGSDGGGLALEQEEDEAAVLINIRDRGGLRRPTPISMAIAEIAWKALNSLKNDSIGMNSFRNSPDQRAFLALLVAKLAHFDDQFQDLLNESEGCNVHNWQKQLGDKMINTLLKAQVRAIADTETEKKKKADKAKFRNSHSTEISQEAHKKRRKIAKLTGTTLK